MTWAMHFFRWILDVYECSCFCCFESEVLPAEGASTCFRLASPKRMGITEDEFQDWCSVITCLARKRSRLVGTLCIPLFGHING